MRLCHCDYIVGSEKIESRIGNESVEYENDFVNLLEELGEFTVLEKLGNLDEESRSFRKQVAKAIGPSFEKFFSCIGVIL